MKTIRLCPNCGVALPADAPGGLCPVCLLKTDVPTQSAVTGLTSRVEPEPGRQFGGYRIVRLLGEGGMGSVYEAEDVESGRRVALKVLRHAPDSPTARQRFLREGRLAASVNHPNSVYIYGAEEIEGAPVITMEYVPGGTLSELVERRGPLPVAEAVDIILQIIAGLEAAAAKGVLHRDVKPSNCFVEADGAVKVGDFGLSISTRARDQTALTISGAIMGTPAYASPEQLRGDELDVRADIYSVGVTFYFLLTGKTPFHAENVVKLLSIVLEKPAPSPRAARPEIPKGIAQIVLRCLAKQPGQRFKDYEQLRQALEPFNSTAPTPATFGLRFGAGVLDRILLGFVSMATSWAMLSVFGFSMETGTASWSQRLLGFAMAALPVVYYTVFEGFWGASLGKWICRLRIVGPTRNPPGFLRALARALMFVVPMHLPEWLFLNGRGFDFSPGRFSLMMAVGLSTYFLPALLFVSARRRNGFAALHDLITGTRIIERMAGERRPSFTPADDSVEQTSDAPTVGPFHILDSLARRNGEEILLGYDSRLLRKVWICKHPVGTAPTPPTQRELTRSGRLRWLAGQRSATECWDAYEGVSGQPLVSLLSQPQPWASVRYWLHDLGTELDASCRDGSALDMFGLDRVWITADGRAKLLDFSAPGSGASVAPSGEAATKRTSPFPSDGGDGRREEGQRFLGQVAHMALAGRGFSEEISAEAPKIPLPMSAREFLQTLPMAKDLPTVLTQLRPLLDRPAAVSRARRLALLLGCAIPIFAMLGMSWLGSQMSNRFTKSMPDLVPLWMCLSYLEERTTGPTNTTAASERSAMEIYVANRFRSTITNGAFWSNAVVPMLIPPAYRQLAEQTIVAHPAPTEGEIRGAALLLEPFLRRLPGDPSAPSGEGRRGTFVTSQMRAAVSAIGAVFWIMFPSLLAAILFRRGLLLRLLRIEIVTGKGLPALRWRTFLRCLFAWLPLLTLIFVLPLGSLWPCWILLAVFLGGAVYALIHPDRSLQDRLAGTWLVPK